MMIPKTKLLEELIGSGRGFKRGRKKMNSVGNASGGFSN
jgi:hypothetical protein